MTTEPSDLPALVAALRAGDPNAMQALYERYAAQLYRYCLFRIGDAETAQDVVQEVFVQVWHGVRTFEYRGDAALRAWLHTIASHAVIKHLRQRRRQPTVSLDAPGDWSPLQGTDMAHAVCERRALRQAIAGLSADQQHVVALRYVAGLTIAEAALVLGRSEGAIKALQHRALLRLHQCLTAEAAAARRSARLTRLFHDQVSQRGLPRVPHGGRLAAPRANSADDKDPAAGWSAHPNGGAAHDRTGGAEHR